MTTGFASQEESIAASTRANSEFLPFVHPAPLK
jgi:hypothetical protein